MPHPELGETGLQNARGPSLQRDMACGVICGRRRSRDQPAALNSPRRCASAAACGSVAAATHLACNSGNPLPPVYICYKLPCAHRRDAASLPGELDGVSAGWSEPATPNGGACGARTPGSLANGGGSLHGSTAAGDTPSAPPRLFIDLRPFMDRAPTTVRCATATAMRCGGVELCWLWYVTCWLLGMVRGAWSTAPPAAGAPSSRSGVCCFMKRMPVTATEAI